MPTGVYKRTSEARRKISNGLNGHMVSAETKQKISLAKMGNKSRTGLKNSKEQNKRIGLANAISLKGNKQSAETIKKRLVSRGGYIHSKETKTKIGLSNTGKKRSEEAKERMRTANLGDKSFFWKGGISFEEYTIDWTKTLRRSIRERDKYTCQLCLTQQDDRAFSVHHIDYDKKNCNPSNLITLCRRCHAKTNSDRDNWTRYFDEILLSRNKE